ncbi:hypothetical protein KFU94_06485 [Chloroflexi bacterium TSY]|nr:hypothetical protein [Chloroflexi bacterium TSY]
MRYPDPTPESEASQLYYAVFRRAVPLLLQERFEQISSQMFDTFLDKTMYETALERAMDLEALEIAGRYTGRLSLLSAKIKLMVFLAETLPDHQRYFVNTRANPYVAILVIISGLFLTIYKLVKGLILLWVLKNA